MVNNQGVLNFNGGYLRKLFPEDVVPAYVNGLNDPEVNKYLEVRHVKQTHRSVVEFINLNSNSDTSLLWGIWHDLSNSLVGTVRIHGINYHQKRGSIGICLFEKKVWGIGIGVKSIVAVSRWAHESLGLSYLEAGVYEGNTASKRAFNAAGYTWSADIRGKFFLDGMPVVVNVLVNSLGQSHHCNPIR